MFNDHLFLSDITVYFFVGKLIHSSVTQMTWKHMRGTNCASTNR